MSTLFTCNSIANNYIVVATHPINSSVYRAGSYLLGLWVAPALSTELFVMAKTDWSIIDWNSESFLFTYSEEERQNNEINKANAKKLYSPEFIPYYIQEIQQLKLTPTEWLVYWFIRFYMKNGWWRFYFNSEQLATILWSTSWTIDNIMSKLSNIWIIETSRKVKSGWWTLRFINAIHTISDLIRQWGLTSLNNELHIKKNKINKNKNIHITANADDDVFLFLSKSTQCRLSSRKEVTAAFWKFKTFEEIKNLVVTACEWSIKYKRTDHPTIRALKWLDLYLKDHNWVKDRMDDNFEEDYDSRSNREEQLYYCRGNAQPHY